MDQNDQGYNPSHPNYNFIVRNANLQFGQPGDYNIQLSGPNGPALGVIYNAPSPARTQPVVGPGIPRSPFPMECFAVPATPPRGSPQQTNVFLGTPSPARSEGLSALEAPATPSPKVSSLESEKSPHPPTPRPLQ